MHPFRVLTGMGLAGMLCITPIYGQTPARVRGTVVASTHDSLTVEAQDGRTFLLKTGAYTAYAYVLPSNLKAIKANDFVGSAVKGPLGSFVAVEVALIPKDMRGRADQSLRVGSLA